jgi:hypothetical protein
VRERPTQPEQVEPAQWLSCLALRIAQRVIHVEAVDEEGGAVDDSPQNEETPGVATPGGPRVLLAGVTSQSVAWRLVFGQWDLAIVTSRPVRTSPTRALPLSVPSGRAARYLRRSDSQANSRPARHRPGPSWAGVLECRALADGF